MDTKVWVHTLRLRAGWLLLFPAGPTEVRWQLSQHGGRASEGAKRATNTASQAVQRSDSAQRTMLPRRRRLKLSGYGK